jgi:hypothetical protein
MRPLLATITLAALAGSLALVGCSTSPTATTSGTVRIRMTDAPGIYDAVNLVVTQVAIHRGLPDSLEQDGMSDSVSGWEILSDRAATYDLMKLRNGVFVTLAEGLAPAGHYTQIRLKLGAGSNVVVDGATYPLTVPSGLQSGYKLVAEFDVPASGLVELALDFDAARSIHQTGNGRYMLKPTCRVMPMYDVGAIKGTIVPDSTAAWVYAISGADTIATGMPALDGRFVMTLLKAGTYSVAIDAPAPLRDTTLAGVVVTSQNTTDLGEILLGTLPD